MTGLCGPRWREDTFLSILFQPVWAGNIWLRRKLPSDHPFALPFSGSFRARRYVSTCRARPEKALTRDRDPSYEATTGTVFLFYLFFSTPFFALPQFLLFVCIASQATDAILKVYSVYHWLEAGSLISNIQTIFLIVLQQTCLAGNRFPLYDA